MNVQDRLKLIRENIARAAQKSKRSPEDVTLIAVTKAAGPEQIKSVIEAGQKHLGESKVQQLLLRAPQIQEWMEKQKGRGGGVNSAAGEVTWHMIGHLQRNKVKPAMQLCRYIHSVDSLRLAEEIQAAATKLEKPMQIFLEVSTSGESSKFGVAVGAAQHLAEQIDTMEGIQLVGLMTMAPHTANAEDARGSFVRLREIFEEIRFRKIGGPHFRHLSMGMSNDYRVAIEEGATMVRIGTALFEG